MFNKMNESWGRFLYTQIAEKNNKATKEDKAFASKWKHEWTAAVTRVHQGTATEYEMMMVNTLSDKVSQLRKGIFNIEKEYKDVQAIISSERSRRVIEKPVKTKYVIKVLDNNGVCIGYVKSITPSRMFYSKTQKKDGAKTYSTLDQVFGDIDFCQSTDINNRFVYEEVSK